MKRKRSEDEVEQDSQMPKKLKENKSAADSLQIVSAKEARELLQENFEKGHRTKLCDLLDIKGNERSIIVGDDSNEQIVKTLRDFGFLNVDRNVRKLVDVFKKTQHLRMFEELLWK